MTDIAAGIWPCKVLSGFSGEIDLNEGKLDKAPNVVPIVRVTVELTEGDHKGQRQIYEEIVDNKQAPYIFRTLKAVGWRCQKLATLKSDIVEWISATKGGLSTVEIKHLPVKNGPKAGSIWVKVGALGRGPRAIKESTTQTSDQADAFLQRAISEDAERRARGSAPPDDDDIPPPSDYDAPRGGR